MDLHPTAPNVNRRRFLAIGGATVGAAAVLAACGPAQNDQVGHTGNLPSTSSTAVPPQAPPTSENVTDQANDKVLLQTMTSVEILISTFYADALAKGWVTSPAGVDALNLMKSHHDAATTSLQAATAKAGAKPYDQTNTALTNVRVTPTVTLLTNPSHGTVEADWLQFARSLEDTAAATYVVGAASFGPVALRQLAMGIGATTSRNVVVLASLITPGDPTGWVPNPLQSTTDAVGSEELIGAKAS